VIKVSIYTLYVALISLMPIRMEQYSSLPIKREVGEGREKKALTP